VTLGPESFSEAQRHSIGVCLSQLRELLATVRAHGGAERTLARIEDEIDAMAVATDARRPAAPRNVVSAALAQMLVLAAELRARRLAAYGALEPEAASLLDNHAQQLTDLTNELIEELRAT
jgi:hypothetical protein